MKLSLYPLVVALAAFATAESLESFDFDVEADMDPALEVREALKGNPSRCNKAAKKVPPCARPKIKSCNKKYCGSALNYKCGCKHQGKIRSCAQGTVLAKCGQKKALKALHAAKGICKCVHRG